MSDDIEEIPVENEIFEEALKKVITVKKSYYPERLILILEDDPDWIPELSGKAVYRSNRSESSHQDITYNGINIPSNTFDLSMGNRHEVAVYIPFGVNYELKPNFGTTHFEKTFQNGFEVVDMTDIVNVKETLIMPSCVHLIASKNSPDANLELYDYPFTMLPLEHSCKANELGHSPKFVGKCNFMAYGNLQECSAYEPFEDTVVAKLDGKDVVLSRKLNNGEILHDYTCGEDIFDSLNDLKKHAESEYLTFEIVWSPISKPVTFLDKIVGRLEVTYPHETV